MFADSMLETSWAQRTRRSWTTVTSFLLEALVIGLLLLLPLWKTVGLPAVRTVSTPVSLGRPEPAPAPRPRTGTPVANVSNFEGVRLIEPGRIPPTIKMGPDAEAPQPPGVFMPGITGIGSGLGLPTGLWSPGGGSRPVPQPPAPHHLHDSRGADLDHSRGQPNSAGAALFIRRWREVCASKAPLFWLRSLVRRAPSTTCGQSPAIRCWCRRRSRPSASGATVPTSSTTNRSRWKHRSR